LREALFVVRSAHSRITLLNFAEQAFFRGQQSSLSVDVDRPTFKHDAMFPENGLYWTSLRCLGHEASDFLVMTIVGVFGPRIKTPRDSAQIAFGCYSLAGEGAHATFYESTAGVAGPNAIRGPAMETHVFV
jgi:hypothetical protein